MKKHVLFFALFMALAGGVFAQNHWISGEIYGPGGGARYEYVITPRLTVGAYVSFMAFSIGTAWWYEYVEVYDDNDDGRYYDGHAYDRWLELESGATVRYYPFARRFFMELNLGFNSFKYDVEYERESSYDYGYIYTETEYKYDNRRSNSFCVAPGFGWTIDLGKIGGLFISTGIRVPLTVLGVGGFGFNVVPYFGIGGAF